MGWVRTGDCPPEQCQGRCCKNIGVWFDVTPETAEFTDWLGVRGASTRVVGEKLLVSIPQRCQYLTAENLCALHPDMLPAPDLPSRPEFCAQWPTEPSQLATHPYCGFRFQEEPVSG